VTVALFSLAVAAVMLVGGLPIGTWLSESQAVASNPVGRTAPADALPVVRASDVALDRARSLVADGRLRDALRALDEVRLADPARPQADRLKAEIQRDVLAAAGMSSPFPAARGAAR
jgi:hypothetical protein